MKFLHFLVVFVLFATASFAQQNHFIYIQTENKQAFYVRLADRVLSSSSTGYLVISKLQDGTYELNLGFPKNEWPLQKITVVIKGKDAGYLLKNFDSKGWGLFNMQTMDIIMSTAKASTKDATKDGETDGFADVLADVVSTPSIKQKTAAKEEKDTPVTKTETVVNKKAEEIKEEKPAVETLKPATKLSSTIDESGRAMTYVDRNGDDIDTIRVFIPYAKAPEAKQVVETIPETVKKAEPKKEIKQDTRDAKFIDMELPNPNSKTDPATKAVVETDKKEVKPVSKETTEVTPGNKMVIMTNQDCKTTASDDDFLKLRKKMAAEKTDEEMVAIAKKTFKSKCFSTDQVSNLSVLFLKDEGRYNFFDAAYSRVSDSQNFEKLGTKLSDEYYVTRFKAMLRH